MKIIDLHCDTIERIFDNKKECNLSNNTYHIDLNKLKKSGSLIQFFAMYVDIKKTDKPNEYCKEMIKYLKSEVYRNQNKIKIIYSADEVESSRINAIISIEEGETLEGDITNLIDFYNEGVRSLTLTWNYPNKLGYPNQDFTFKDKGLTDFGKQVVESMNDLGMLVDVSHLSDKGFEDVAQLCKGPFIASHSNCREIWYHYRNLTDKMIRTISQRGGVVGVNYVTRFLSASKITLISDIILHIKHLYNVGGIDVISIGGDFDGTDSKIEISDFSEMKKLWTGLKNEGFSESEIDKIFYKNALRTINEVLK